jgi:hypothetical protein
MRALQLGVVVGFGAKAPSMVGSVPMGGGRLFMMVVGHEVVSLDQSQAEQHKRAHELTHGRDPT